MAMTSCKECGKDMSDTAKACPHCGARISKTKWWLWIPLGLVALVVLIPQIVSSPAERKALTDRGDCERAFPTERGKRCDEIYNDTLRSESGK